MAADPRIVSVTTHGQILITGTNADVGLHPMVLRLHSKASIYTPYHEDVLFTVTVVPFSCTQTFTDPVLDSPYLYYIKQPVIPLVIPFTGMSNGSCDFDSTVTIADGSALDPQMFTYTKEQVKVNSVIDTVFGIDNQAFLTVIIWDIRLEGQYNFTLTIHSKESPADTRTRQVTFTVNVIDNPCT
jgi:hypothetical protein